MGQGCGRRIRDEGLDTRGDRDEKDITKLGVEGRGREMGGKEVWFVRGK